MDTLTVEITEHPHAAVITIAGEARIDVRPLDVGFMRASAVHPNVVVLDLAGLTFVSSLAMGSIVALRNGLRRRGGKLLACNVQPLVLDSFVRARLNEIFEVHPTLEAALLAASAIPKPA